MIHARAALPSLKMHHCHCSSMKLLPRWNGDLLMVWDPINQCLLIDDTHNSPICKNGSTLVIEWLHPDDISNAVWSMQLLIIWWGHGACLFYLGLLCRSCWFGQLHLTCCLLIPNYTSIRNEHIHFTLNMTSLWRAQWWNNQRSTQSQWPNRQKSALLVGLA